MRRSLCIAAVAASFAFDAHGGDPLDLSGKTKAAVASVAPASTTLRLPVPFTGGRDPLPELLMQEEQGAKGPRSSCEYSSSDVCYDLADARIVYRPVRQYMPRIGPLEPDSISLRQNRVIFKYTF